MNNSVRVSSVQTGNRDRGFETRSWSFSGNLYWIMGNCEIQHSH